MTTDEDGLLAAIAAAPRDDAPRLVYADWLQERGQDAKAEYLRTVVRLMHPPEDPADVARCMALAADLDAAWREQVGAGFEVMLEGDPRFLWVFHLLRAAVNIALHEALDMWEKGKPVRLQSGLTREDAEHFVRGFGLVPDLKSAAEAPVRLVVWPMEDDPRRGVLALPVRPRE